MDNLERHLFFALARLKGYVFQKADNDEVENGKYLFSSYKGHLVGALEINIVDKADEFQDVFKEDSFLNISYVYLNDDPSLDGILAFKGLMALAKQYAQREKTNLILGSSYESFIKQVSPILDITSLAEELNIKPCNDCTSNTLKEKYRFLSYSDVPFFMKLNERLKNISFLPAEKVLATT
ncbi:hypothetical protein [Fulvivirga lutimaris]|uniref:hypothetical protein n=1 Tax=Fulvivirga lutimaris TaxID=1819566 RepID=UPI0012BBCE45|nr:hypothetical protein [Fulvivirga lutimaris]MTI40350.1 hypothetical protein [Fulvivirga lutimaris]